MQRFLSVSLLAPLVLLTACGAPPSGSAAGAHRSAIGVSDYLPLNLAAGTTVLYEAQVRSANACRVDTGSTAQRAACTAKIAPTIPYRAEGTTCSIINELNSIKLGTIEDMTADTTDYRQGITLRYIKDRVGANTVWLMPVFPNNMQWGLPDACDNLGSPYAVRDYMHVSGTVSRACITAGADEYSTEPCWGNASLDTLIQQAHARGLKVMLDLAFNHFGHNYQMYDYLNHTPIRERLARGENLDNLWSFDATYEQALVQPQLLDTNTQLTQIAQTDTLHANNLAALKAKCPNLTGAQLVRAYHMWSEAFDWERNNFNCTNVYLEWEAPGFYLGSNRYDPSVALGDNFTNNWPDVKFLYHHEENGAHKWEFWRQREYLFRVMNYWASRGVDAFRLDHTTDADGGMGPNEWKYIITKVNYYNSKRGMGTPIYLAEEFHDQMGMNHVVDVMTDGYVGNMNGRNGVTKDAYHVQRVIDNGDRFGGKTYVMTALETHDEHRLTDGTGFNVWTGAGFWAIGATTWSTPMLLMGQEFGEPWGVGFRRSDFIRGRFEGTSNYNPSGDALVGYYNTMITRRLAHENRALYQSNRRYLPRRSDGGTDPRIFAMAKWEAGGGNVVFVFHNLWEQSVAQSYYLPGDLTASINLDTNRYYKLVDVVNGQQYGNCRRGADLAWEIYVSMDAGTRFQWIRLESC